MSAPAPRQAHRWLGIVAVVVGMGVLATLLLTAWREPVLGLYFHRDRLEALVHSLGPAGPLAIVALQVLQIVLAPVPGQLVGMASGFLFGPWLGTLYNMIGVVCGNALSLFIARRFGRAAVERLCDRRALARIDRLTGRLGLPVILLIYILPFLPGDTITLVAGLTDIPLRSIMLAVLFGRLPGIFISSLIGSRAGALTATQWAIIGIAVAAAAGIIYRYRAPLQERLWYLVERTSRREEEREP